MAPDFDAVAERGDFVCGRADAKADSTSGPFGGREAIARIPHDTVIIRGSGIARQLIQAARDRSLNCVIRKGICPAIFESRGLRVVLELPKTVERKSLA